MIKNSIILAMLVLCSYATVIAQPVSVINGSAPSYAGKKIRLVAYDDQVSCLPLELASAIADTSGKFSLTVNNTSTLYAELIIDDYIAELYLKPSKNIRLKIIPDKNNEPDIKTLNPFQAKILNLSFPDADPDDINLLIYDFNILYSDFVEQNFKKLLYRRDLNCLDSFKIMIDKRYDGFKDEFFQDIIDYKIAALEFASHRIGQAGVVKKYFPPGHIKYDNPGYMEFFIAFFESYSTMASSQIKYDDLVDAVNVQKSYLRLFNVLGADTLLQNEVLRELVMLVTLKGMYYTQGFDKKAIVGILAEMSAKSNNKKHKVIASNMVKMFSRLQPGTKAPYFKLKSNSGKFIAKDDFQGKYIYLTFWSSYCVDCEADFKLIAGIYPKFKDKIEIVSVSVDKYFMTMQQYLKDKNLPWVFLHFNEDYELLENYNIKTLPFYILIDPEGNILEYPAKSPLYNLDSYFNKIINRNK